MSKHLKSQMLKNSNTYAVCVFCASSWNGSWRCARRRVESCKSMPTVFYSKLQTTAPTSWSRLSMPWKSRPDSSDLAHDPAAWSSHGSKLRTLPPLTLAPGRVGKLLVDFCWLPSCSHRRTFRLSAFLFHVSDLQNVTEEIGGCFCEGVIKYGVL